MPARRSSDLGATELIESLGPQAIDDILVGHYVPLLEFNHERLDARVRLRQLISHHRSTLAQAVTRPQPTFYQMAHRRVVRSGVEDLHPAASLGNVKLVVQVH